MNHLKRYLQHLFVCSLLCVQFACSYPKIAESPAPQPAQPFLAEVVGHKPAPQAAPVQALSMTMPKQILEFETNAGGDIVIPTQVNPEEDLTVEEDTSAITLMDHPVDKDGNLLSEEQIKEVQLDLDKLPAAPSSETSENAPPATVQAGDVDLQNATSIQDIMNQLMAEGP